MIEVAPGLAEKGVDLLILQSGIDHRQDEADVAATDGYRAGSHQAVETQRGREGGQRPARSMMMSRSADNTQKYALSTNRRGIPSAESLVRCWVR
jgi:hypothetical protein